MKTMGSESERLATLDSATLVQSAKDGDKHAGAYLVSVCGPQLYAYAKRLAQDVPAVDRDLLCERAVERAVTRLDLFDPSRATFETWLRAFLRHEVGDWRRRNARHAIVSDESIGDWPTPEETPPPPSLLTVVVSEAFERLSATDQVILRLRAFEGLSFADIAAYLGTVNETACRQRHYRALQRLRGHLIAHPDYESLEKRGLW